MQKKPINKNTNTPNFIKKLGDDFYLTHVFKNSEDIILIFDDLINLIYVNQTAFYVLEIDTNSHNLIIEMANATEYSHLIKKMNDDFNGGNSGVLNFKLKNLSKRYFDYTIQKITEEEALYYMVYCKNVTEQIIVKRELNYKNEKIKAIFESGNQHIFSFNKDYIFTEFNINTRADSWFYFNYNIVKGITNVMDWLNLMEPLSLNICIEKAKIALSGKPCEFELVFNIKKNVYWRKVYFYPIYDEESNVVEVSAISHNITASKRNEIEIQNKQAKINAILESGDNLIFTISNEFNVKTFNNNFLNFCLKEIEIDLSSNTYKITSIFSKHSEILLKKLNAALTGIPQYYELHFVSANSYFVYEMFFNPIVLNKNEIEEVSVLAVNSTEMYINRDKLIAQNLKLDVILNNASYAFVSIDEQFNITSFNNQFKLFFQDLVNKTPYNGINVKKPLLDKLFANDKFEINKNVSKGTVNNQIEILLTNYKSISFWCEVNYSTIPNNNGTFEYSFLIQNVNDKKIAQEMQKASLLEKEILLKEIHHRVKNNLQVVSSILNLQSGYVKDANTLEVLKESQNRIKSMSFIHELLYQSNEFNKISFSNYIHNIVRNLVDSYRSQNKHIAVHVNIDDFEIDLDTSIPCGLIVNELMSNSFKHAFKSNGAGNISITCKFNNGHVELRIKDDGIGLPEHINVQNSNTLGMQLVMALIEQIDAKLEIESKQGTSFLIIFVIKSSKKY